MPNRIIREGIKTGEKMKPLGWAERVCFMHLMVSVDDFGRIEWNSALRAVLYPVDLDKVRDADIERWIAECEKSGLVVVYHAAGRRYVEIQKFNQRTRAEVSKCPAPPDCKTDDRHVTVKRPPYDRHPRTETETETLEREREKAGRPANVDEVITAGLPIGLPKEQCEAFWDHYASSGWVDGKGLQIVDWRPKLGSWKRRWEGTGRPMDGQNNKRKEIIYGRSGKTERTDGKLAEGIQIPDA